MKQFKRKSHEHVAAHNDLLDVGFEVLAIIVVDDCEHQVHENVDAADEIGDEEQRPPSRLIERRHHNIGKIDGGEKRVEADKRSARIGEIGVARLGEQNGAHKRVEANEQQNEQQNVGNVAHSLANVTQCQTNRLVAVHDVPATQSTRITTSRPAKLTRSNESKQINSLKI